jgi:hypothetical protein
MKYTYIKETDQNWEYIKRSDGAIIPIDEGNADYQRYLNPEAEQSTPIVINEAEAK